ncbi:hypothetical protein [Mesorhizobium sp. NZP2077]|uniref:hypothetical protein n=1 Tax=Mesorhizobium sp. NZP2077 TaxID=2483404 RepID=UPI0015541FF6|nr:hypothetical protein [Mesorhizobium sp. NZP2077]QKC83274.1 hypothetical protein EB232_18105 [Mesorhizobium sp. NZP2077]QKD16790.1 hypothetical protein HGP13_17885 [Mesorhizobium sp. NZP2077]
MDAREAILQRLVAIAQTFKTDGIKTVYRNNMRPPEPNLPAILVLDGDEVAAEDDPNSRGSRGPRRMTMTPQLLIVLPETQKDVGTTLNAWRAKLIRAIATDTDLMALTTNRIGGRLHSTQTSLAWGRSMLGEMGVAFAIPYYLDPNTL